MEKKIGFDAGLHYIYLGNVTNNGNMDKKYPQCAQVVIVHSNFGVMNNNIQDNHCPNCGMEIVDVGLSSVESD